MASARRASSNCDLKRADLFPFGLGKDGVGIKMPMSLAQALEDFRPLHFPRVILRIGTKIFVTDDAVVGAHLFLGANLQGAKGAVRVHGAQGGHGHFLLQRLGGEENHLASGGQPVRQRRVQAGRGFARAGRGLGQQIVAGGERLPDGVNHYFLAGAPGFVGERQRPGRRGFLPARFFPGLPNGQQTAETLLQFAFQGGFIIGDGDGRFPAAGQIHIDQRGRNGGVAQLTPHKAVEQELPLMALEGRAGTAAFLCWKISGLEFLDQPAALAVRRAAVEPAGDQGRPLFDRAANLQMDFPAIGGMGQAAVLQDAGVQLRAQAQAMPSFAPPETDAGKVFILRQFPDRDFKYFRCRIKFQNSPSLA